MHDPMTLAFSVRGWLDVWHVDPEKDGTDDSCDWFGRKRPLNDREKALRDAIWQAERVFGNAPYYPGEAWDAYESIQQAMFRWRARAGFRWHPRWHVHHWRFRVWPLIHAYRWLFVRCSACGGRIWPSEGLVSNWGGGNPQHVRHGMYAAGANPQEEREQP